jgi:hypothetical protein
MLRPKRREDALHACPGGDSFVVSDDRIVLEWSDPRGKRFQPGPAPIDTELTIPLSARAALIGCFRPDDLDPLYMPAYVAGVNSRTIHRARAFIAAWEDRFIL